MAADNPLSVNLPPVQWTTGTPPREPASDSTYNGDKKGRKSESRMPKPNRASVEVQFEQAVTHQVDSFA